MMDLAIELSDALRDRYTIEREIGRGGMATVYLARDLKHGRSVALKVMHPELVASLSSERFRREVLFAARLQHPHILTVLDSGETAGVLWFTMAFVEGESLRERLVREKQLPIPDALLITHHVASALDFAHRHGIIHRDIKPENILLIGDDALVADFGIARALAHGAGIAGAAMDRTITAPGATVGTAAYMSPEQATAETYLDGRTDVYALACVLYEMLAGEPPFTGPTVQAVIAKRFLNDVPSVRSMRPVVSDGIDRAIRRALAPVRADRFRTPSDFYAALQPIQGDPTSDAGGASNSGDSRSEPGSGAAPSTGTHPRFPAVQITHHDTKVRGVLWTRQRVAAAVVAMLVAVALAVALVVVLTVGWARID